MGAAAGAGSCQGTSIGAPPSPGVGGRIQGPGACELEERSSRRATLRSYDPISAASTPSRGGDRGDRGDTSELEQPAGRAWLSLGLGLGLGLG